MDQQRGTLNQHISSAWQAQLDAATPDSRLKQQLLYREDELLPRFTEHYQQLTSLSRQMRRSLQRQWKRSLGAVALSLALSAAPVMAGTINIGGRCLLASAINAANMDAPVRGCAAGTGADTIVLPPRSVHQPSGVNNRTYGPTGLPVINSAITIVGNDSTIRRAPTAPAFGILAVGAKGNLTLKSTTVTGGQGAQGNAGGIYVVGRLNLVSSTISGNRGGGVDGAVGGDRYSAIGPGSVTVRTSTISGNTGRGLDLYNSPSLVVNSTISNNTGAGVYAYFGAYPRILNSTISGNKGTGVGCGYKAGATIFNSTVSDNSNGGVFVGSFCSVDINHSTITGNSAKSGGGIEAYSYGGQPTEFNVQRSIVAGNEAAKGPEIFVRAGDVTYTSDFSVIGQSGDAGSVRFTPSSTDIVPTQPIGRILNTRLAANGGPTSTHALVARSPAIDAITDGTCPPPARDQRGVVRPRDGNGDGGPACDIGAFER